MTGYGRVEKPVGDKTLIVEIRSLNSKLADLRIKSGLHLGQRELELRKIVLEEAIRGKIDMSIDLRDAGGGELTPPNVNMIKSYYSSLKDLATELDVPDTNLYNTILRLPNIFMSENGELDDALWDALQDAASGALEMFTGFRRKEGKELQNDLRNRIQRISELLEEVDPLEVERAEALRSRLDQKVNELEVESADKNRFEQEILYYLDKLDIHEEKVRLFQHCKYFLSELETGETKKGKKLNFISQEIGREINTMGAKAQWSPLQHVVVQMKNELEKVKEQLANVL